MQIIDHSRSLIAVTGEDAATFLQGLITQDIHAANAAPVFSAILSPQGKWADDFFILKQPDGYWLDVRTRTADALIKKLSLYKLRAKVGIHPVAGRHLAYMETGKGGFADPRHPALPARMWFEGEAAPAGSISLEQLLIERLEHALPEGGVDATENETLLDLGYDLLNAVSFTKGCYVGQEVTARMHYKSISRKGFYHVRAHGDLPREATAITANGKTIAQLRSRHLDQGIAFAKFEDVGEHKDAEIEGITVTLSLPEWLRPRYELHVKNKEA